MLVYKKSLIFRFGATCRTLHYGTLQKSYLVTKLLLVWVEILYINIRSKAEALELESYVLELLN